MLLRESIGGFSSAGFGPCNWLGGMEVKPHVSDSCLISVQTGRWPLEPTNCCPDSWAQNVGRSSEPYSFH